MTAKTLNRAAESRQWDSCWHSIREASLYCGLPESTLRYYEQIGIIGSIERDPVSGHRVYDDNDLAALNTISCLSATGMSLADMRQYMKQRSETGALDEIDLLRRQQAKLDEERDFLEVRSEYVGMKIQYWDAVVAGRREEADQIGAKAAQKAKELRRSAAKRQHDVKQ